MTMTDNEIIESMKSCMRVTSCCDATYAALKRGLKLIERQRTEIERLKSEEIVRCGDCKFYRSGDCSVQTVKSMYPNDYCSYGERKGDTNER